MQNHTQPQNMQDVLNRVHQHFIVEDHPLAQITVDPEELDSVRCRYRMPSEANGCGIGCMIPDRRYVPGFEGFSIDALLRPQALRRPEESKLPLPTEEERGYLAEWFGRVPTEFLAELQTAHDGACDKEGLIRALRPVAASFGLTMPTET